MRVACWLLIMVTNASNFAVIGSWDGWGESLLSGLIDAVGGSADLVEEVDAVLRGGRWVAMLKRWSCLMRDDLDLEEELEERLVLDMSRGIGRVGSCEGCGVLDVW